ncbi:MAG: hypothetical protein NZT92_16510 [Abditibacteriales bacterium]|nr:hypothetical protein [Abditibacteriales bacterium]
MVKDHCRPLTCDAVGNCLSLADNLTSEQSLYTYEPTVTASSVMGTPFTRGQAKRV